MGRGPTSLTHTWRQDPAAPPLGNDGSPTRESPFLAVMKEAWFIGAVGAAVFLALALFVAAVCYKRKSNEKRAVNGYKGDSRGVNGASMSSGLWIERGPWGAGNAVRHGDEKTTAATQSPEKLLNLHGAPSDYAEVDGTVVPLIANNFQQSQQQQQQLQTTLAPGTPVAYATTNILRSLDGENVEPNIPVYTSMYGENNLTGEDNVDLYCTLKKQLFKSSLSPAVATKQSHGSIQRGYFPPWEAYLAPPLPENPPPDPLQQAPHPRALTFAYNNPNQQYRHQSPIIARALNRQQNYTNSLPRAQKMVSSPATSKRSLNAGNSNSSQVLSPPHSLNIPGSQPTRRDPSDPLPQAENGLSPPSGKSVSPIPGGLQGLQGLSGSRLMGTPGAPRRNNIEFSPARMPDMYGGSIYQGPIDEREPDSFYRDGINPYTDQSSVYESASALYGQSPHSNSKMGGGVFLNNHTSKPQSNHFNHTNTSAKIHAVDRTNPLLNREVLSTPSK